METNANHGLCFRTFSSHHATYRMDVCKNLQSSYRKYRSLDRFRNSCLSGRPNDLGILKEEECCQLFNPASLKVVLTMAVATSIDALAVGISFAFLGIQDYSDILSPILIIGFVSFVLSLIGLIFGIQCGCGLARKLKAELWGGIILVIIGIKILIEHLFFQ